VKGTQVEVNSLNGVVQLSGFVDTPEAKDRAGQIASSTKGVVQVFKQYRSADRQTISRSFLSGRECP